MELLKTNYTAWWAGIFEECVGGGERLVGNE